MMDFDVRNLPVVDYELMGTVGYVAFTRESKIVAGKIISRDYVTNCPDGWVSVDYSYLQPFLDTIPFIEREAIGTDPSRSRIYFFVSKSKFRMFYIKVKVRISIFLSSINSKILFTMLIWELIDENRTPGQVIRWSDIKIVTKLKGYLQKFLGEAK